MKNLLILSVMLTSVLVLSSCEKDELLTDSERIEKELRAFVDQTNVFQADVYVMNNGSLLLQQSKSIFSIEDGFFVVFRNGNTFKYNLLHMSRYVLRDDSQGRYIVLYFD